MYFGGALNDLLKELDKYPSWRKLNKMRANQSYRFTKQEIILRFFAFHDRTSTYEGHLAKFLNSYMQDNKDASSQFLEQKRSLFKRTVDCVWDVILSGEAPPKLSLTVLEALLVGVSKNIDSISGESAATLRTRFKRLTAHEEFSEAALREGLSKKPRVVARLATAASIFSGN